MDQSEQSSVFKQAIKNVVSSGALKPLTRRYAGSATCLMYHSIVGDGPAPHQFDPYFGLRVSSSQFEDHIEYVARHFEPVSIDEALAGLAEASSGKQRVVITFDDGYRNNLTRALPILEKFSVPATIYVTTGFMDRTAELWWEEVASIVAACDKIVLEWRGASLEWNTASKKQKFAATYDLDSLLKSLSLVDLREFMAALRRATGKPVFGKQEMLSSNEVLELSNHELITIGAHTVNHPSLRQLEKQALHFELADSKRRLEELLGSTVTHLAYPIGEITDASFREFEAAREVGFSSAVTTRFAHWQPEHAQSKFALPRLTVSSADTIVSLARKLSGAEAMFAQRGKRVVTN